MKKLIVLEGHKRSKASSHEEITNEENVRHFLRYQGYCSRWIHSTRPSSQPNSLCGNM